MRGSLHHGRRPLRRWSGTAPDAIAPRVAATPSFEHPRPNAANTRLPYMPGLDGLRAVAVMAVLAYHANLFVGDAHLLGGGFLGVEVFFVISGFLITSLLLQQRRATGRIDLATFYRHRARRLLPAVLVTLLAVTLISVLFLHDEVAGLRGGVLSSLAYATNWFFIASQQSYFESMGRPSLVQHLWSLAVEEQFYLVWPALFVLGMARLGRNRLYIAVVAGVLASAWWMAHLHTVGADLTRVYEGTDTRAVGLLIGVALAFLWAPGRLRRDVTPGARNLLDGAALLAGLVLLRAFQVSDSQDDALYRFGFARLSLITAVLIAVVVHPASRIGAALACRPLRWIGVRSYGIYLYHWPVFQLTRPHLDVPFEGVPLLAIRLGITVGLAELSLRYLETPIRHGALGRLWSSWRPLGLAGALRRLGYRGVAGAGVTAVAVAGLLVAMGLAQSPAVPDYGDLASTDGATGHSATVEEVDSHSLIGSATPDSTVPVLPPVTAGGSAVAPPAPARRVRVLGDSVMKGAGAAVRGGLRGEVTVDAEVGRQVGDGLKILRRWRDDGALGDVVVVHLGNNGTFRRTQFEELRQLLADVPRVVLINNKVPGRSWETPNNVVLRDGVADMPNAVLVDWKLETDEHPELLAPDGVHMVPAGAARYRSLISEAADRS